MKNKKAQLTFVVVLVILTTIGAVLLAGSARVKTTGVIGAKQTALLNMYTEAEAAREYIELAAQHSTFSAARALGASGTRCFGDLFESQVNALMSDSMENYLATYEASGLNLNTTLPSYTYSVSIDSRTMTVNGIGDKIKVISQEPDATYEVAGNFSVQLTCKQYSEYLKVLGKPAPAVPV